MVSGVYVPAGVDGRILAALESFAETLIQPLADAAWEDGDTPEDAQAKREQAEATLADELRRYLRFGDWRTYQ
jgi:hypothetical protein